MNSVEKAFHNFDKRITKFDEAMIKNKQLAVTNLIKNNIGKVVIHEIIPSGSSGRNTAIVHASDIDLVCLVSITIPKMSPKEIMEKMDKYLTKATNNVEALDHAFKFTYNNFKVDLVFAYGKKDGPWNIVNSGKNKWDKTDPKKNKLLLNKLNGKNKNKVKPVIRFMKKWNKMMKKNRVRSFHLECIIYDIFSQDNQLYNQSYSSILARIGPLLKTYLDKTLIEPAGVGPKLIISPKKKGILEFQVNSFISATSKALKYEKQGKYQLSIDTWKKVFGNQFG